MAPQEEREEEKLTLAQAARLLDVPPDTVARWARQGKLPVDEEGGQYVFSRQQLAGWARRRNIFLHRAADRAEPAPAAGADTLAQAARRGGVFFGVGGRTVTEVLKAAARLVPLSEEIDRDFVADLLIQREHLASTGVGAGVAVPHPRYPLEALSVPALLTTCFLERPVDFKAVDGAPVGVLFLLLCSTTKNHLHYLSRLSFCLRDPEFVARVSGCKDEATFTMALEEREALVDER